MPNEDDKTDVTIETTEETKLEETTDDKAGENKEEEDKGKKEEEGTDEIDLELLGPEKIEDKKDDEEDPDEDEMDPDDKKKISKIVDKKVVEAITKATEMTNFLKDNPQFSKYEKAMELYRNHPTYKNTPLKAIAAIVAFKDAERLGAAKEREASKKVAETKDPGHSSRRSDTGGIKDWSKATQEEVEAQRNAIVYGNN